MAFEKPADVRRSFARGSIVEKRQAAKKFPKPKRMQRPTYWPGHQLNYEFLEKCKELVCRVPHTSGFYKYQGTEIRVNILRWSRGSYLDIRQYYKGHPTGRGILLHLDMLSVLMPEIVAVTRKLELEDTREPDQKSYARVIPADAPNP